MANAQTRAADAPKTVGLLCDANDELLNIERGIMDVDTVSGHFRPEATVSGIEALVIIRQLQNAVRMEF